MEYDFKKIEQKWQAYWAANQTFKAEVDPSKPKYYVLDMFPYPSGAGLHVGHPLGYIASDIYSRYKRLCGFNVLHPMGYDAFGLPAEQYAIQTGQHPAVTTEKNIARYREQMDRIGFSYDWSREIRTCDPEYYKWTQWAFIQMFESWYDNVQQKARPIAELEAAFAEGGSAAVDAACGDAKEFTAQQWNEFSAKEKSDVLMQYRIAYQGETAVNWCPALGTVLANDEVKEGYSVRGGHPVEQKKMTQWQLRVSAYAGRLLDDLDGCLIQRHTTGSGRIREVADGEDPVPDGLRQERHRHATQHNESRDQLRLPQEDHHHHGTGKTHPAGAGIGHSQRHNTQCKNARRSSLHQQGSGTQHQRQYQRQQQNQHLRKGIGVIEKGSYYNRESCGRVFFGQTY